MEKFLTAKVSDLRYFLCIARERCANTVLPSHARRGQWNWRDAATVGQCELYIDSHLLFRASWSLVVCCCCYVCRCQVTKEYNELADTSQGITDQYDRYFVCVSF